MKILFTWSAVGIKIVIRLIFTVYHLRF